MAGNQNNETLGELYARIGLNFDELENGMVEVERTLAQNLARLNRERNIINLQTRIDLTGLDAATDATRIFEVRQRSLQQQLQNQRTRLNLLNNALQDTIQRTGENSDETQNAQIAYENARLAVARLENQLEELNENQNRGANWTDRIVEFSSELAPVLSVSRAIFDAFSLINDATDQLIEKFKDLQKTAYDFNLPIEKADEFARKIRLAGGDLDDIGGYLRGITDALIKGEIDDPEWLALKRYDETIFDAKGKLKSYAEIWEAVHRAFKKAKAEGNEINFLQMTGGESGVTDAMKALQNWEKAVQDADKIIKAKIDYSQLDEATRQTTLLSEQMDEFGKQVTEIFSPVKTAMVENFFSVIRAGTEFLAQNRDALKSAFELPNAFTSPVEYQKAEEDYMKHLAAAIQNEANNLNKVFETSAGLERAHAALKKRLAKQDDTLTQYSDQRATDLKKATEDLRLDIDFDSDYQKALAQAKLEQERALTFFAIGEEEHKRIKEKYLADIEKAEKDHQDILDDLWRETAAIQYEATHSAFEKQIYDIEQWKKKAIEDLGEFDDAIDKNGWIKERDAIIANAAAKERQAIETERERILDLTKETASLAYEATHSAFEKEIHDIEQWKQAQLDKAATAEEVQALIANAAEKEARAFENEIDRIKGKNQSLMEKIFEQTHSQFDIDVKNAQKELAEYLAEGIYPTELLNQWYQQEIAKFKAKAKDIGTDYTTAPKVGRALPKNDFYGDIQKQLENYTPQFEKKLRDQMQAAGNLDDLSVKALDAAQALSQIPSAVQDFQKLSDFPILQLSDFPILQMPQIELPDLSPMYQQLQFNLDIFNTATNNASIALTDLAISTQDITTKIETFSATLNTPTATGNTSTDLSTAMPEPDIGALQELTQHLDSTMQPLNQQLVQLTQNVGAIAQSVSELQNRQPPNITVSPNISIDLGGAYVFDNRLKSQLTDDIASEVADAITDAVQNGLSSFNLGLGYGN